MASFGKLFTCGLLTIIVIIAVEYKSTRAANQILPNNPSTGQVSHQCFNVTRSMSVLVNTMAVLSCCFHPIKNYLMLTWEIHLRDNTPCILAYRSDRNETKETNCSGEGITREIRPEWNNTLRIDSVTTDNDGYYKCVVVAPDRNFQSIYHLSVLVPPTVTLSEMGNGTVVCKAAVGKPAAQISWVPEGDCFTVNETHDNRTVTVKSMCIRNHFNESNVTCFISHLTGNKNLSTEYGAQDFVILQNWKPKEVRIEHREGACFKMTRVL
ncbi:cell surface glycoprotein CD200 receptor 1-like isoform X2 [Dromiciops gliroides]|uniref:cell surface glycoprotein CD200 receptor 1-like isoform X2 n=1 Tax=Dromiciops gliroides TaxID=33562 RepID=UPI001CC46B53|nr:cell surface glycoprotein CD200 receptor 1-like isoform X2 [Dromiciops gliroides]